MPTIKDYFQNIATAIKQKNTQIVTVTPAQMPQAILDIPSGGGGDFSFEIPLSENWHGGYISSTTFYYSPNNNYVVDVYELVENHSYIMTVGVKYEIYRGVAFSTNPLDLISGRINGARWAYSDQPNLLCERKNSGTNYHYLAIQKSNTGDTTIKTYVIDCTDWS